METLANSFYLMFELILITKVEEKQKISSSSLIFLREINNFTRNGPSIYSRWKIITQVFPTGLTKINIDLGLLVIFCLSQCLLPPPGVLGLLACNCQSKPGEIFGTSLC